ncbi:hypothetical protein CYMTET_35667 [Cymbomonas tetramitiformis]|uniref:Uncharacterized protein n=1 Tax=Cymbomonas tetramitiformis TaxID=36881 RepID=A0AAE0F8X7_9CHLO|nr:hypothetical protein CYMTET_35667 [Cymbomonas tetramitiformis]
MDLMQQLIMNKIEKSKYASSFVNINELEIDLTHAVVSKIAIEAVAGEATQGYLSIEANKKSFDISYAVSCKTNSEKACEAILTNRIPLFLCANTPNYVGYENTERANNTDMFIANAKLRYLCDSEDISFGKAYVVKQNSTTSTIKAVINKQSQETISLIQYALNSPLFSFGTIDNLSNFENWANDDNFLTDQNEKWIMWELFYKIKQTYIQLQKNARVYTDLSKIAVKLHAGPNKDDEDSFGVCDGKVGLNIFLYVPLVNALLTNSHQPEEAASAETDEAP